LFRHQEGIEHLKQYFLDYGHARVPRNYKTPSDFKLGVWAQSRRYEYNRGALPAERIKALEDIPGWVSTCKKPM